MGFPVANIGSGCGLSLEKKARGKKTANKVCGHNAMKSKAGRANTTNCITNTLGK